MSIKVLEDNIKDAKALLSEAHALIGLLTKAIPWVQGSQSEEAKRNGGPGKYIVLSRAALQSMQLTNFDRCYPTVAAVIANGRAEEFGNGRLVDGVYKIGQFNAKLQAAKYLIKTDNERQEVRELLYAILGDLALFIIMQFGLATNTDAVMLSVQEYCEAQRISPDILYGELLGLLEEIEQSPYGYEPISPYYDDLMGMDPVFVAECEEAQYPLTEDVAQRLLSGALSIEEARGQLAEFQRQVTQVEVKGIDPGNMVSKLNLS